MSNIEFTHYWVTGFGWEHTIFQVEDFVEVEKLGESEQGGFVFIAINKVGANIFLKVVTFSSNGA